MSTTQDDSHETLKTNTASRRRSKIERIRVSENVHWRDQAVNDFAGNLSVGVLGMKKRLHPPVKRTHGSSKRLHGYRKKKINSNIAKIQSEDFFADKNKIVQDNESSRDEQCSAFTIIGDDNMRVTTKSKNEIDSNTDRQSSSLESDTPDESLQKRASLPSFTKIRHDHLKQKPTEELDLSSDEEDENTTLYKKEHYNRLAADENVRPKIGLRHFRPKFSEINKYTQDSMWNTRGKTLLGYDFVAGSDDNRAFLGRRRTNYESLREFRELHNQECEAEASDREREWKQHADELDDFLDHHCIHSYRVNSRLFAQGEDVDEKGRSMCSICSLLQEYDTERPSHARVIVPSKLQKVPKLRRTTRNNGINSLALFQNCEFASTTR